MSSTIDQVGALLRQIGICLLAVMQHIRSMPAIPQTIGDRLGQGLVIFDDDYSHAEVRKVHARLAFHDRRIEGGINPKNCRDKRDGAEDAFVLVWSTGRNQ